MKRKKQLWQRTLQSTFYYFIAFSFILYHKHSEVKHTYMKIEKKLAGVCAWLAVKFELDVTIIRLVFVIATIIGVGSPILIYLILWLIKPNEY